LIVQKPRVSICVANLNSRKFLGERFESIFQQSFQDWELIVYDSFSDDGAWEYIQELAVSEPRMRITQGPREGVYAGWNSCLRQARGEYVYIATSDDTMSPDCLEKLVAALDEHPECDLAHCCATFIDENSNPLDWKWEAWPSVAYFGDLIKTKHIRPAGHDCVLACALTTPYYSITQLLIRRSLFEKTGLFETRWGSMGDLEWQMRATLVTPTLHIPEHLATWRKHPEQASQMNKFYQAQDDGWFIEMADAAIAFSKMKKSPTPNGLPRRLRRFFLFNQLYPAWNKLPGIAARVGFLSKRFFSDPHGVVLFLKDYPHHRRGQRRDLMMEVQEEVAALGLQTCLPL
jgi:GT2 family glycosyltransferase